MNIRLGLDLDNTIICYDELFARLAAERSLVPTHVPPTKQAIRDYLRQQGCEPKWTELQGLAYGSRIGEAAAFPGVGPFLSRCTAAGVPWWIISHRTRFPCVGEPVDLHQHARQWLHDTGLVSQRDQHRIYLEITRDEKLRRIKDVGCNVFMDDLVELLTDREFPTGVRRILFDPQGHHPESSEYDRVSSWFESATLLGL